MLNAVRRVFSLILLLTIAASGTVSAVAQADEKPNIVFILADDLEDGDLQKFPNIWKLLALGGTRFDRFFVPDSWCCPSRASILRCQYVHSHGVLTNTAPEGGFEKFFTSGLERSTIGTWMKSAGYRTGLLGKYLNHYPGTVAAPTYVPEGWDDWAVPVRNLYQQYNYTLNENGVLKDYGALAQDYLGDVLTQKANSFVTQQGDDPFFLYLAPISPHNPASYAPRYRDAFADAIAPRTGSFDQSDVKDEPAWLRALPRFSERTIAKIDERYRNRLRSMLSVDDMVGTLIESLRATGKLENTYIFFSSDNGFHLGQHRLAQGKTTPFDESIKVPLLVRGPGIRAGGVVGDMSSSVDLAPTFTQLGGAVLPSFAEGRSLLPLLRGRTPPGWRQNVLLEFYRPTNRSSARQTPVPPYSGMRTAESLFVRYATGEYQLYDLARDPYELHNLAARVPLSVIAEFNQQLDALVSCSGANCRSADSVRPPSLPVLSTAPSLVPGPKGQ
ncbi:sulfatase [Streptosporangium lutulentum]|uniref:Arylsulfatase A-like enzyme n=1 Tax=Streptosporangium lutulentum TaxID=1461250 RepID=A0ABT9QUJ5_9ACTN|nr:sulfatase [Streptosporangium lutulentum]MDP9850085.1 arylsulfatase A-like enzyme [Streptosporangium lutulentum]